MIRRMSSRVILKKGDIAWKTINSCLIGPKVLIISADDANSIELRNRLTFELQRIGKNSFSFTMLTTYATEKTVEECHESFQRSGCSSVITLGSQAISDTGKGVIALADNRVRKVKDLFSLSLSHPLSSRLIPLVSIPTNISPIHYLSSSWSCYNMEDDALVSYACSLRDLTVIADTNILLGKDQKPSTTLCYVASHIYDLAFCLFLQEGDVDISTLSTLASLFRRVVSLAWSKGHIGEAEAIDSLSDLCLEVAKLRAALSSETKLHMQVWPGIVEICSVLIDTTAPATTEAVIATPLSRRPFAITSIDVLLAILKVVEDESQTSSDIVYAAAMKAKNQLCDLAEVSSGELLQHLSSSDIPRVQRTANRSGLSGDSLLAGAQALEELRLEDVARAAAGKDDNSHRTIFSDDKEAHRNSPKLRVLKSDFTSDVLRAILG